MFAFARRQAYWRSVVRAQCFSQQLRVFFTHYGGVQLFHQHAEQAPEVILAGITADTADFTSAVDQYEQRRQPFGIDKGKFWWYRMRNIDAAQRCTPALVGLAIDWRDLAVESFAPRTAGLFKYDKLGRVRV